MKIVRNLRTAALVCRNDVVRGLARNGHYVLDPYTGERVNLATGFPSPHLV